MNVRGLPDTWINIKLNNISKLQGGFAFKSKDYCSVNEGVSIVRMGNISKSFRMRWNWNKQKYFPASRVHEVEKYLLKQNDLLICLTDLSKSGDYLGTVALMDGNLPALLNQRVSKFLFDEKIINRKYLYYGLIEPNFRSYATQETNGTIQQNTNHTYILNYIFSIAPRPEQDRIVAKVDVLMAQVATMHKSLERIPQLLKDFRQQVLTQAVTGKLTEEWREGKELESSLSLLERIVKIREKTYQDLVKNTKGRKPKKPIFKIERNPDTIFNIPDLWVQCSIGDIGEVCNGSTPSRKINEYWQGTIPWVSSGLVQNNKIFETEEFISKKGFENSSVRLLPIGSVLIAMVGEGKTRGQSSILKIEATTNQNIAGIIINHNLVLSEYLQYWFLFNYEANRTRGGGTGPKALNGQKVRELDFVLPPIEEQKEIVRRVESLFNQVDTIEEKYKALKTKIDKLPQAILHKAFKGELVEQLPTDGDAADLLREIQNLKTKPKNAKVHS